MLNQEMPSPEEVEQAVKNACSVEQVFSTLGLKFNWKAKEVAVLSRISGIDIRNVVRANRFKKKADRVERLLRVPAGTRCKLCGTEFSKKYSIESSGEFCSKVCAKRYSQKLCFGKKDLPCKVCGKNVSVNVRTGRNKVLCSDCRKQQVKRHELRNHKRKVRNLCIMQCKNCGKDFSGYSDRKFCSTQCASEFRHKTHDLLVEKTNGVGLSERVVKPFLRKRHSGKCDICGTSTWLGKPILLIMDHIDGHASNNRFDNLRFICSNCDATLPTYKYKNKISDRRRRR